MKISYSTWMIHLRFSGDMEILVRSGTYSHPIVRRMRCGFDIVSISWKFPLWRRTVARDFGFITARYYAPDLRCGYCCCFCVLSFLHQRAHTVLQFRARKWSPGQAILQGSALTDKRRRIDSAGGTNWKSSSVLFFFVVIINSKNSVQEWLIVLYCCWE